MTTFTILSQSVQEKITTYFEENPHTDIRSLVTFSVEFFTDEELKEIISVCECDDYDDGSFSLYWKEYNADNTLKAECGFWISESKCQALGFEFDRPYVDDTESWEYSWHGW